MVGKEKFDADDWVETLRLRAEIERRDKLIGWLRLQLDGCKDYEDALIEVETRRKYDLPWAHYLHGDLQTARKEIARVMEATRFMEARGG